MRTRPASSFVALSLSLSIALVPTLARAQAFGSVPVPAPAPGQANIGADDVIVLKDGGMLRGTLVELMPGDHASLQLATGQIAVVRWDSIARVDRGTRLPVRPAPVAPVAVAVPQAIIHVDADRPARLERRVANRDWGFVCEAPCDIPVDLDREYRVSGDGIRNTRGFRLQAQPGGRVVVDVNTSSKAAFAGGIVLASVGGLATLVGLFVTAYENAYTSTYSSSSSSSSYGSSSLEKRGGSAGPVFIVAGLGSVVGGIILAVTSSKSGMEQVPVAATQAGKEGSVFGGRTPSWADARLQGPPAPAAPQTYTVLSGSF